MECTVNGYDNKKAIKKLGFDNETFDVMIIALDRGFTFELKLSTYLERIQQ
jgi:hypothetical protein